MSYLVRAAPSSDFPWLERRTGWTLSPGARAIEVVDGAGRIRGMVAFDGWTRNSCQAHLVLDAPSAGRALAGPAFEYAFNQAGKGVLLGAVAGDNARSLALARRLGFVEVARVRDAAAEGVDLILFEMRRETCRWLSGKPIGRAA